MRYLIAFLLLLPSPLVKAADPAKEIKLAAEKLNAAFETHDAKAIRSLMTPDHLAITPYAGKQSVKDQLQTLADLDYDEYSAGPMSINVVNSTCAVVTYKLKLKGNYKGKPLPPQSLAASVWVKEGGKWRELHYQETPVDGR
jgi:ketosteroid isomerase-like protein